jgi:hypothetical protein
MMDCSAALLATAPLDPRKLPNYVSGMVLGATDFRQVLVNFDWKHRNSNLLLHGFGTVCGLKVSVRPPPSSPDEIGVSAGFAISPRGRWIRVEPDQCASLGQWLQAQTTAPYASPGPGAHKIFVTLCYNQCLTDLVPIAGQQCAPDADNQAPSRILESFKLEFSWTPPAQPLEDRARQFGALMRQVEIIDASGSLPSADDSQRLFAAVRALRWDPLPLPGSLPDGAPFRLPSGDAETTIREALTIWVTEICPAIRPTPEKNALLDPATDDCLLLAAIEFGVDSLGRLMPSTIQIDETQRPVLVPTRILQELFVGAGGAGPGGRGMETGTVTLAPPSSLPNLWAPMATQTASLPSWIGPDMAVELAVEDSAPPLPGAAPGNVALTLYRPASRSLPAAPIVAATNLSGASIHSLTVRWRAYPG